MSTADDSEAVTAEIFWRPGCPYCAALRRDLSRRGVSGTWRNIWDDEEARRFVRGVNGGNETVPTVRVGQRILTNPSGSQVARLLAVGPAAEEDPELATIPRVRRILSWLPVAALIIASGVLARAGHGGLSWGVDGLAVAAWWFTRPLRR